MLNGECYTFQGLVRRLREEKFDPSLEQVQEALYSVFRERDIWFDEALKMGLDSDEVIPDDYEMDHIVTLNANVSDVQELTDAENGEVSPIGSVLGMCTDSCSAHRIATTDWFGRPGVRTVWRREYIEDGPDSGEWGNWRPLYFVLGQAEQMLPVMPVREPEPPAEGTISTSSSMWCRRRWWSVSCRACTITRLCSPTRECLPAWTGRRPTR